MCIPSGRTQGAKHCCCHNPANQKNGVKVSDFQSEISPKKLQPFVCEKFVTKPVLPDLHFAKEVCRLKNIGEAQTTNRLQNNVSIFLRPLSRPGPCSFIGFRTVLTFDK